MAERTAGIKWQEFYFVFETSWLLLFFIRRGTKVLFFISLCYGCPSVGASCYGQDELTNGRRAGRELRLRDIITSSVAGFAL